MTGRFLFWKKNTAVIRVSVMQRLNSLYLAVTQIDGHCAFFTREITSGQSAQQCFIAFIREMHLQNAEVYVVLNSEEYQQVSVERPNVADDEMHQSLVWAIKDFTAEPAATMAIDFYDVVSGNRNNNRIQVVCTSGQRMRDWASSCHELVNLKVVTIDELAMADLFDESTQVHVLLHQHMNQELHLLAIWNGQVCLSRSLRGYQTALDDSFEQWQPYLKDQFVLDIQRSCDYLVGQLKLPQVSNLYIALNLAAPQAMASYLDEQFQFKVSVFAGDSIPADKHYLPVWGVLQGAQS